jgi:hypothetical protein
VIQQQLLDFANAFTGLRTGTIKVPIGFLPQRFTDSVKQGLLLFGQHYENLVLNQVPNRYAAEPIMTRFGKGSLNNFFDKKTLNLSTAQKTFQGIDGAIYNSALNFCRLIGKFEFPFQVSTLPSLLMKAWHHHLGKTVHGDLVGSLGNFFTPGFAMAGELLFNLFTVDMVPPMVAVAVAVWTVEGGQGHGTGN